ncbi:MAG: glycosyltransferase [Longimicrobiales bacterium]
MDLLLLYLPWIAVGLFVALIVRLPPGLPTPDRGVEGSAPMVSIIVPARNEEENIGPLLESLTSLAYPAFEVLVVDDESEDRTPLLVREGAAGNAEEIRLIRGEPLPDGWLGKPWACAQGAREARGELLLFTDADTRHEPTLLRQAVAGLESDEADVLTLVGRQIMGSFWERILQPQFFMLLAARFPRAGRQRKPGQWRHAIANGQYLLFRRDAYEAMGGHGAVRGEVVEDLRMAQLLVHSGRRLVVREGRGLSTRMYRSLGGLVEGWSKNLATGALQATAGWLRPMILPLSFLVGVFLWLLPPVALAWALATGSGGLPLHFGAANTGLAVLFWGFGAGVMGESPLYGILYPLGSILAAYIFLLSWARGGRIRWRGRRYSVSREARIGGVGKDQATEIAALSPSRGGEKWAGDPGGQRGGPS